jgi:hypothetical protein
VFEYVTRVCLCRYGYVGDDVDDDVGCGVFGVVCVFGDLYVVCEYGDCECLYVVWYDVIVFVFGSSVVMLLI